MKEVLDMVCICCRNHTCEYYTIYDGNFICEYCLDDWLKSEEKLREVDFEYWCKIHKEKLDKEENHSQEQSVRAGSVSAETEKVTTSPDTSHKIENAVKED